MTCDICGQNQATVHFTEIVNDQMTELHLCEECAKEKGAQMEQHFDISDLLAGLADFGAPQQPTVEEKSLKCPKCGLTYNDFKKIGRLGCEDCYMTFKKNLAPLLKRIHGSSQHYGKGPLKAAKDIKSRDELSEIRGKLQKAIAMEDFEEAARLRDKIKELEKGKKA